MVLDSIWRIIAASVTLRLRQPQATGVPARS